MLAQEVDQLKRMLKAGANWDVISQMMSYISDKAAQVESLAADIAAGTAEATPQSKPVFAMLGGKSSKVTNRGGGGGGGVAWTGRRLGVCTCIGQGTD